MIPRIRGRSGIIEDGDYKGKWAYEISFWELTGENQIFEPIELGPFNTKEESLKQGHAAIKEICEMFEEKLTGETSGKFLDLKNGAILRPWENH